MRLSGIVAALVLAAAPIAAQQPSTQSQAPSTAAPQTASQPATQAASSGSTIMLQGCVKPGVDAGTVIMTDVTEMATGGRSALPAEAHGRKVIFWLDDDAQLKPHVGHMVEVSGTPGAIEKSEVELKAGHQSQGGLVVEFEGPGKDVKASNADVGQALGTSGRTEPNKDDVKTFLLRVKVNSVKPSAGACS